jgi:CelD/BcsL family acetyltransferase involved in cellulose biosynthesis
VLAGHLLEDLAAVEPHREAWDELAVDAGQPYCAPGWMLAWWRAAAPEHARLRVAVALEGERLVGVAPFYAERRFGGLEWLRVLAAPISSPTGPVAQEGREREAAQALAQALSGARPRPGVLAFDGVVGSSPWPQLLAEEWPGPGRARLHTDDVVPALTVALDADTLDSWLSAKSSNFRGQVRRLRRQLDTKGATFVRVGLEGDVSAALRELARLHYARWEERGGSGALDEQVERVLALAAADLAPRGRFWVSTIVADGRVISAHLTLGAGPELVYWLGGHDDAWAAQKPGLQALVEVVQMGLERQGAGEGRAGRLHLGPGAQEYKSRLADGEESLVFSTLAPRDPGWRRTRALLGAYELRRALAARLTDDQRLRMRRLLRRGQS